MKKKFLSNWSRRRNIFFDWFVLLNGYGLISILIHLHFLSWKLIWFLNYLVYSSIFSGFKIFSIGIKPEKEGNSCYIVAISTKLKRFKDIFWLNLVLDHFSFALSKNCHRKKKLYQSTDNVNIMNQKNFIALK